MPQMRLESASLILRLLFTVVAKMLDQNGSGLSNGQWVHHSNGSNELSMVSVFTIAILHCMKMMQKTILNACTVKKKNVLLLKRFLVLLSQFALEYNYSFNCNFMHLACIPSRCVWCFFPYSGIATPLPCVQHYIWMGIMVMRLFYMIQVQILITSYQEMQDSIYIIMLKDNGIGNS